MKRLGLTVFRKSCGTDHFLTVAAPAAPLAYAEIAAFLSSRGLVPVQEKLYGLASRRSAALRARAAAFRARGLDASTPVTWIEGRPVSGGAFAGVQLWAVRGPVATVRHPWGLGRAWSRGGRDFLYLPALGASAPGRALPRGRAAQARKMFRNAGRALRRRGFEFAHTARTWIYLRGILGWYDEFNRIRSALYRRPEFFGDRFQELAPASTGIEGFSGRGDCVMDLLAVRGRGRAGAGVRRIRRSACQGPAPRYGSAFSRAVVVPDGPRTLIHVSGTASIDAAGATVAPGDPEAQSLQTLRSVDAVLAQSGAGLADIRTAVLFCRDRRAHAAFQKALRRMKCPGLPALAVLADVCRPDLELELEAVAAARR